MVENCPYFVGCPFCLCVHPFSTNAWLLKGAINADQGIHRCWCLHWPAESSVEAYMMQFPGMVQCGTSLVYASESFGIALVVDMHMSDQMSCIGCKLSLLSNMDVRYEGILCAVNIEECSVALTKVRCFGTEDRPTANRVAALDDVFEYIIFKSSDIKDLYGLPNDPAILSASQQRTVDRPNTASSAALGFDTTKAAAHGMMRGQGDGPTRLTSKDDGMKSSANATVKKMMSRKEKSTLDSDYDFVKANEHSSIGVLVGRFQSHSGCLNVTGNLYAFRNARNAIRNIYVQDEVERVSWIVGMLDHLRRIAKKQLKAVLRLAIILFSDFLLLRSVVDADHYRASLMYC
uniref:Lsm14-like N-terminal domain-containing protein n=1 Tax=Parascaris equorum TaxID=6256 RepID=A0A914S6F5_PAREQ